MRSSSLAHSSCFQNLGQAVLKHFETPIYPIDRLDEIEFSFLLKFICDQYRQSRLIDVKHLPKVEFWRKPSFQPFDRNGGFVHLPLRSKRLERQGIASTEFAGLAQVDFPNRVLPKCFP